MPTDLDNWSISLSIEAMASAYSLDFPPADSICTSIFDSASPVVPIWRTRRSISPDMELTMRSWLSLMSMTVRWAPVTASAEPPAPLLRPALSA